MADHRSPPALIVFRGLPNSGKSSMAAAIVHDNPEKYAIVNRDSLRHMIHPDRYAGPVTEDRVTTVQYAAVAALLGDGCHVIVDDTNLDPAVVNRLIQVARAWVPDVRITVLDLRATPLDTCLARNAERTDYGADARRPGARLPEARIREMYDAFVRGQPIGAQDDDQPVPYLLVVDARDLAGVP